MTPTMTFTGGLEIERALKELGDHNAQKRLGRRALKKAAEPVRDKAKRLARRDEGVLEDAIEIGTRVSGQAKAKIGREADGTVRMFVGIDQSAPQEVNIYSQVEEFRSPFMRPAWDSEGRKSVDRIAPLVWDDIQRTAKRLAKKRARAAG